MEHRSQSQVRECFIQTAAANLMKAPVFDGSWMSKHRLLSKPTSLTSAA